MGLLDNVKSKIAPAKGKVSNLAQKHEGKIDKVERGLDRAADAVDKRTKGKYSGRIHSGTDRAKGAMDRLAHKDSGGTTRPPDAPQAPPAS
ncbi:antitoxin [Streptomyces phyllanthi]|uniref:Antitoxin n=1 Tax=Streptomyces phyllanthi TaxID=1803180 RepID=A0A5N8VZA9_9ACTN|nr:antitoxin [Streptomyces phyllanthi]MPY40591.1 antitoxin [Streptomyces phyllanthi]